MSRSECEIVPLRCGMANCCLLKARDGGRVLVDTGPAARRRKLYEALKGHSISVIVLTHGHYDHIQNAAWLADKLGAKIAMSEADTALIMNQSARKASGRTLIQKTASFFANKTGHAMKVEPFVPDILLSEGDSLNGFGIDATVVALPGHTAGSIGLTLNDGKDFIAGDACMNIIGLTEPFLFEDYGQLKASMKKIEKFEAENIYFGHGSVKKK